MRSRNPTGAAGVARRQRLPPDIPFPVALFALALLTDVTYWRTADPLWSTMSSWLLLAGLIMSTAAVLTELIRVLGDQGLQRLRPAWIHMVGNGLAVLLSVGNFIFHVRDGYSAVIPAGPLLSAAVVLILLLTAWMGRGLVPDHRGLVGAADHKEA